MAVSVRMDPLMEKELELAAKRKGVTKSQFIIEAVERALGRKDPATLYRQVMEEASHHHVAEGVPDDELPGHKAAWVMDRSISSFLDRQLLNDKNPYLSYDEVDGRRMTRFGGIPILRTDALAVDEATVS